MIVVRLERLSFCIAKLMSAPTARQLEQRAEEARVVAEQMRDPRSKLTMANLALSYKRLAKHAAMREANEARLPLPKDDQNRAA
jgi:hypothetical protein